MILRTSIGASMVLGLLVPTPALAQFLVAPPVAGSVDANGADVLPGSAWNVRWQAILDPAFLPLGMPGQNLTGLWFRRNAQSEHEFDGGSAIVTITLSHARRAAADASNAFDLNHAASAGGKVVVYQGPWMIPLSISPVGRTVGWANPGDIVGVPFTTPFAYQTGPLCIEIVATRTAGAESQFWNLDVVVDSDSIGSVARVGTSCANPDGVPLGQSASVGARELVAGSTLSFAGLGSVHELVSLSIGFSALNADLTPLGIAAPGCRLLVDPVVNLLTSFRDNIPWSTTTGHAQVLLELPSSTDILGAAFIAQFIQLTVPLTTSEALYCTVASGIPTLGGAMLVAKFVSGAASLPAQGRLLTTRAPVIRFGL